MHCKVTNKIEWNGRRVGMEGGFKNHKESIAGSAKIVGWKYQGNKSRKIVHNSITQQKSKCNNKIRKKGLTRNTKQKKHKQVKKFIKLFLLLNDSIIDKLHYVSK